MPKQIAWSRRLLVIGTLALAPASFSGRWAAPQILMVYGAPLKSRVIVDDRRELFQFVASVAQPSDVSASDLAGRPFMGVAFYWRPIWLARVQAPDLAQRLRAEDADQHARFYPATAGREAVLVYDLLPLTGGPLVRSVTPQGLELLERWGVPIRVR